jgi:hypothetical protein
MMSFVSFGRAGAEAMQRSAAGLDLVRGKRLGKS